MGKKIVLSNIPVHVEQNPENSFYFDPNNALELSNILEELWVLEDIEYNSNDNNLITRTLEYGEKYSSIVCGLFNK